MGAIRVVIAEDHTLVREGTRDILEREPDIQVVGEAATGVEAVASTVRLKPDVVLMDIRMPELSGVDATREICDRVPQAAVLVLSAYDDDDYVLSLLDAGASGYLLKTVRSDELVDAVRRVHDGETVLHPEIARKVARLWRRESRKVNEKSAITSKEMEVLRLVSLGLHNKEIARELEISVRTVEGHMSAIFDRLNVRSRTEAAMLASSRGWFNEEQP